MTRTPDDPFLCDVLRLRMSRKPVRQIAAELGVNGKTVTAAFERLAAQGFDVPRTIGFTAYSRYSYMLSIGAIKGGPFSIKRLLTGLTAKEFDIFVRNNVRANETLEDAFIRIIKEKVDGVE